jgi:hypothetical protein
MKLYLLPNATGDFFVADEVLSQFEPSIKQAHTIIDYPAGVTLMVHNSVPPDIAKSKQAEFKRRYADPARYDLDAKHHEVIFNFLKHAALPPSSSLPSARRLRGP